MLNRIQSITANACRQPRSASRVQAVPDIQDQTAEQRFGTHVRTARESRGWTQDQLARKVRALKGVDLQQSAIARIEAGQRTLRLNEFVALAEMLGLDLGSYGGRTATLSTPEEYQDSLDRKAALMAQAEEIRVRMVDALAQEDEAKSRREQVGHELHRVITEVAELTTMINEYDAVHGRLPASDDE